jgi:drug/metabolite transporter (DMT)-like permease
MGSVGIPSKAWWALAATSILWGTTWVASRMSVQDTPGLQVACIRQFIAGAIWVGYFLFMGEKIPKGKTLLWLLILSFFIFVLANGLSTWSVRYISSGLGSLIGALYPMCVVLLELVFFKKKTKWLTWIGLFLGLTGVAVVFYENTFHEQPEGYEFGILLGMVAMLAWSAGTLILSKNKVDINPYYAIGWQMLFGSVQLALLAAATGQLVQISSIPLSSWLTIGYLVSVGSILTFSAFIYSIRHLPASLASLYAYINPIVAMVTGALVLNESITLNLIIGAVITVVGVYIVNHSIKKET